MNLSTAHLFAIKFIHRYGAILDLTRDHLDISIYLHDENISPSATCRYTS